MTTQPLGADEWSGRKAPNDKLFLSHSTAPKVLHSDVLENWMLSKTATETVLNLGTLANMDSEAAEDWIMGARFTSKPGTNMTDADAGVFLHEVLEHWVSGEAAPPIPAGEDQYLQPMMDELAAWMIRHKPELVATELVVYNLEAETAGRGDLWVRFREGPLVGEYGTETVWHLDLKTTREPRTGRGNEKKPYADSVGIQLAGGRWAEYWAPFEPRIKNDKRNYGGRAYLLNDTEREALRPLVDLVGPPEAMKTAVVHLTPEWCRTWPIETERDVLEHLKAIRKAWLWKNFESPQTLHPYIEGKTS